MNKIIEQIIVNNKNIVTNNILNWFIDWLETYKSNANFKQWLKTIDTFKPLSIQTTFEILERFMKQSIFYCCYVTNNKMNYDDTFESKVLLIKNFLRDNRYEE